jgi:Ca2+:H+ antiporter
MGRESRERRSRRRSHEYTTEPKVDGAVPPPPPHTSGRRMHLPQFNHNGHEVTPGIKPEGESGRRGFHPLKFFRICFRSSCTLSMLVNFLWPMVPVAIALVRTP